MALLVVKLAFLKVMLWGLKTDYNELKPIKNVYTMLLYMLFCYFIIFVDLRLVKAIFELIFWFTYLITLEFMIWSKASYYHKILFCCLLIIIFPGPWGPSLLYMYKCFLSLPLVLPPRTVCWTNRYLPFLNLIWLWSWQHRLQKYLLDLSWRNVLVK